jgi:hypothetical protein
VFPTNDAALDGLKTRMASWGVPPDAAQIIDGSGLSRRDAVAPDVLLAALQRMYDPAGKSPFMQGPHEELAGRARVATFSRTPPAADCCAVR